MWYSFDNKSTIGQRGSENGVIIRDEEHIDGSRITLERDGRIAPFSITCGIYGWMVHTRFFSTEQEAQQSFIEMQYALEGILKMIPLVDDPEVEEKGEAVSQALSNFVEQYP